MPAMQQLEETKIVSAPRVLRARVLLWLGWTLLVLSLALLSFHVLWMWQRMGTGAPLVGGGLLMDALVGVGLIVAGYRARRKQ
jgi:hypothetical protein